MTTPGRIYRVDSLNNKHLIVRTYLGPKVAVEELLLQLPGCLNLFNYVYGFS